MGYYISVVILGIAAALQSSILPAIRIEGGQPELVLLLVISWAVHAEWEEAVFWAFAGGIMQDLLAITPTGTSAIGLVLVVFGIKLMSKQLYRFNLLLLIGFALLGTILQHLILNLMLLSIGYRIDPVASIKYFTAPALFYNFVLILPVYWIVRRVQNRLPKPQTGF